MFLGHFAVALAAKRTTPKTSLGTLIVASQCLDLLWPLFVLLGIEHFRISPGDTAVTPLEFYDYPFSHSLLTSVGWSLLFGGATYLWRKDLREATVLGFCVFSHWLLDFLTHRPDLPIAPGLTLRVGLGLWDSLLWTLVVELVLFTAGAFLYARRRTFSATSFTLRHWIFVAALTFVYLLNVFGPPPPGVNAVIYSACGLWLFVLWGFWIDRDRPSFT